MRTVWPTDTGAHLLNDPWRRWNQCRVLEVEGRIVSMLKIYRRPITWGDARVWLGGIGAVLTLPEFRGRGYAGQVLGNALTYMRQEGYALSVLFSGLTAWYGRFGWVVNPRAAWEADLQPLTRVSTRPYLVQQFDPDVHLPAVAAIHARDSRRRHGTVIRSAAYWNAQLTWSEEDRKAFAVALRDDRVVGYLRGAREPQTLRIDEAVSLPDHRTCFRALAGHAVRHAKRRGCSHLRALVPPDNLILPELRAMGLNLRRKRNRLMMVQVIDGRALATALGRPDALTTDDLVTALPPLHFWNTDAC